MIMYNKEVLKMNKDYITLLESEIRQLEFLLDIAKKEDFSQSLIFVLTSLKIKKQDMLFKIIN